MRDDVWAFGDEVASRLGSVLGDQLVGVYFVGSVALGGYVPGESDIDIAGVCAGPLGLDVKHSVVEAVESAIPSCAARGLEFSLYRSEVVGGPARGADFEVNVNGGARMERTVRVESEGQPPFWYILDRGVARQSGIAIVGPRPEEVFADIGRSGLTTAMAESMRWHRENETGSLYSVLNACRAWRFAAEGVLGSKLEGAAWAADRWHRPEVINAAVELRHGRPAALDAVEVDDLLRHVQQVLDERAR